EGLRLVLETSEDLRMPEASPQDFDGDGPARPLLLGSIDDAHAAGADRMEHEKLAEPRAWLQRSIHRVHVECWNARRVEEIVVRDVERREEFLDASAQAVIGAAAIVEHARAIGRVEVRQ